MFLHRDEFAKWLIDEMFRHGDEFTGPNYTIYLEHLGNFFDIYISIKITEEILRPHIFRIVFIKQKFTNSAGNCKV